MRPNMYCSAVLLSLLFILFPKSSSSERANMTAILPTPVPEYCLHCICIVESNCKMPTPVCQVDVGSLSCGPFQIKQAYWSDATLKGGDLKGSWKICTAEMECSRECVQGYMARYATSSRLGHEPTCEDFARVHNGGPNGYKNPSTLKYWEKVKECIEKERIIFKAQGKIFVG